MENRRAELGSWHTGTMSLGRRTGYVRRRGLLALLLFATACGEGPSRPVAFQLLKTCLLVPQVQDQVFRDSNSWSAFHRQYAKDPTSAPPAVDFTQSVVAAHFDGTGSACVTFTVESVEEEDGQSVVRATRHVSTNPCIAILAYPQVALTIARRDLSPVFRISETRDQVVGQPACY